MTSRDVTPRDVIDIGPTRGLLDLGLRELWRHRELVYFLVWRDVKVRYRQTFFGAAWAVLQPLLLMVVFSFVLGRLLKVPSGDIPYPVFVFAGLVPWQLFSQGLIAASNSLVSSPNLVSKTYFPRLSLPVAAAASYLLDFVVAIVVLGGIMLFYGVQPSVGAILLPVIGLGVVLTAVGIGTLMSAVNVKYRDVRYALPFVVQLWLLATPVAYPSALIPKSWRPLLGLNPMAGMVEATRWALLGVGVERGIILVSSVVVLALVPVGLVYFRRAEKTFADWV
jgi:lipopolysaccharide transport system permease protein